MTLELLVFGFSLPHSLTPPIPTPPSIPPVSPHTHSTLWRSMTVSCGFSGPAVTCVLLIYRHYSRQANPEALSLSRQPGSSLAKAYLPLCRVGPCQVIQLYQVFWKQQQRISCTQMNSIFVWLPPPPFLSPLLSPALYATCNGHNE